jgi:hypothetical protein
MTRGRRLIWERTGRGLIHGIGIFFQLRPVRGEWSRRAEVAAILGRHSRCRVFRGALDLRTLLSLHHGRGDAPGDLDHDQ